jgi:hypothetical protein
MAQREIQYHTDSPYGPDAMDEAEGQAYATIRDAAGALADTRTEHVDGVVLVAFIHGEPVVRAETSAARRSMEDLFRSALDAIQSDLSELEARARS